MTTETFEIRPASLLEDHLSAAKLDPFQRKFVEADDGHVRLLAPAGSGKTHSLLWRCAELYRRSNGASRFLVVTFTRAARDELRNRLFTPEFKAFATDTDVVTLNGWGNRVIKDHFQNIQMKVSEGDKTFLMKNALQSAWSEDDALTQGMKDQPFKLPKVLIDLLETMKSLGFDHEDGSMRHANDRIDALEELGLMSHLDEISRKLLEFGILENGRLETFVETAMPFFVHACETQQAQAVFTLEDQKYVSWLKLRKLAQEGSHPDPGAAYTHILVDEFQDINPLDLALIRQIADLHGARITIVGDDDQAIFEWRGATPDYILEPQRFFDRSFETHILERNYRCPKNIVTMSGQLIAYNKRRVAKTMTPMLERDAKIDFFDAERFVDSTEAVMAEARRFVADNSPGAKFAILSRKRAQIIPYQIMMAREGMSFCAAEDLSIFMSETFDRLIRALQTRAMAALPIRVPTMVEDVLGLCNSVRRFPLSKSDADRLGKHLRAAKPKSYDAVLDALEVFTGSLKGKNDDGKVAASFARSLRRLVHAPTVKTALEAIEELDGFKQDHGRGQEDIFLTDPPFFYLTEFAESYGDDFQSFIDDLETAKDTLVKLPGEDREDAENAIWKRPIHLMTALRAKGKEFDTVVMLDMVDGIWPLRMNAKTERGLEAERRLFYVAMTRAKRRLILTSSGRIGDQAVQQSPFIEESGLALRR
ncbi:ATP-dependent helicase [Fulvimarina sp. MAC3]|uniref:ATP-dependent helicase n=1 Tax=Fulvimarina sp. MAC3 TaxID=3148887 RepID=UPI0031FDDDF9